MTSPLRNSLFCRELAAVPSSIDPFIHMISRTTGDYLQMAGPVPTLLPVGLLLRAVSCENSSMWRAAQKSLER